VWLGHREGKTQESFMHLQTLPKINKTVREEKRLDGAVPSSQILSHAVRR
jgi:hypothetical protein